MSTKLKQLLNDHVIDAYEYDCYVVFEGNDLGRAFLKNKLNEMMMLTPMAPDPLLVMQQDGRRSEWRDIKFAIDKINHMME